MKVSDTGHRLQLIMRERGLKQVDILRLAAPFCTKYKQKLGRSHLSQFVSGKVEPGQWKLTILGLALNVSEAWLMGYDVPMEREMDSSEELHTLFSAHETELIEAYRRKPELQPAVDKLLLDDK